MDTVLLKLKGYALRIENAQKYHAKDIAYLTNLAGEGMPAYIWSAMIKNGDTAIDVGASRALRQTGNFSYTNVRVCLDGDNVLGMLLGYPQPDPYETGDLSDMPAMIKPLVELEALAPGSWYINAIATYELYQGKGVASRLMLDTEQIALTAGCDAITLICASENLVAKNLYYNLGFREVDSREVVGYPGCEHTGEWVLMFKEIGPQLN